MRAATCGPVAVDAAIRVPSRALVRAMTEGHGTPAPQASLQARRASLQVDDRTRGIASMRTRIGCRGHRVARRRQHEAPHDCGHTPAIPCPAATAAPPARRATAVAPVRDDERLEVTVRVRSKTPLQSQPHRAASFGDVQGPHRRGYLTREQHALAHGASAADLALVARVQRRRCWPGRRRVQRGASQRGAGRAGTRHDSAGLRRRAPDLPARRAAPIAPGREGHVTLPAELRRRGRGRLRPRQLHPQGRAPAAAPARGRIVRQPDASFTPDAPREALRIPRTRGHDGSGQCVALIGSSAAASGPRTSTPTSRAWASPRRR